MPASSGSANATANSQTWRDALVQAWQTRGPLAMALFPFSLVFAALVALRRLAYRVGLFKTRSVSCTVLVVGNAIAGGAGKTPTTIAIVKHLRQRGLQVAVVSRGYRRATADVRGVTVDAAPDAVGDEPLLIARATGVPVFVGRDRHAAALQLLQAHPQTRVIVCDDGLQHHRLARDVQVCVFDDRGVGNGWLLPAGPLREPWPPGSWERGSVAATTLVLHTGEQPTFAGYRARRALADHALGSDGQVHALADLRGPVLALAGIARPQIFFDNLQVAGVPLNRILPLADHYDFAELDTDVLQGYQVLCTEKDAVKLWQYWPDALSVPLLQSLEPDFLAALDAQLDRAMRTKLSFRHGHQTA